ncbi:MAG TPA: NADPH-dependent 2,4-dienoyl-CoA reductase, partial [Kribbella sp.]
GVDVSEFLTTTASPTLDLEAWKVEWGVADPVTVAGGLGVPHPEVSPRKVYLLQRKPGKIGAELGRTTGWVHRAALKNKRVEQLRGVNYERIDDDGLHVTFGPKHERARVLSVDTVVVCAGQEPVRDLVDALRATGRPVHLIGGADVAAELDAKRAIDQATRLALTL